MSVSVAQLAVAGGTPVRDTNARPWPAWPAATEEDIAAVADVLRSGEVVGHGTDSELLAETDLFDTFVRGSAP